MKYLFLLFPGVLSAQTYIGLGYAGSYESPIEIDSGETVTFGIHAYVVNDRRMQMYRNLHQFAKDTLFSGQEREILGEYAGLLESQEQVLAGMSKSQGELDSTAEKLKQAEKSVEEMRLTLYRMEQSNGRLQDEIKKLEKHKKRKWWIAIPVALVGGFLLGKL